MDIVREVKVGLYIGLKWQQILLYGLWWKMTAELRQNK